MTFIDGFKELMPSAYFLGEIVGGIVFVGIPIATAFLLSCLGQTDYEDEPDRP